MSASPSPLMTLRAEARLSRAFLEESLALCKIEALVCIAGPVAQKRALRGSPGGWRKFLSWDTLKAYHESGHISMALSFGRYIYGASIETDVAVKLKGGTVQGGYAIIGICPEPPSEPVALMLTDWQRLVTLARLMDELPTWRSMLRAVRAWRTEAEIRVEDQWGLITKLASELEQRRVMNQADIAKVTGQPRRIQH